MNENEIAYSINPQSIWKQGCLVLDILRLVKNNYSHQITPISESHSPAQLRTWAISNSDKEALSFLLKEEVLFQQRAAGRTVPLESMRLKCFHIPLQQTSAAFGLLAPTQKIFCEGKQLIIDLFGQAEFYYEGIALSPLQLEIKGRLRWKDTDISLHECAALIPGRPHWFVYGISVKKMTPSPLWKQLLALSHSPLLLEGGNKQQFFEELDPEDSDCPQLIMKAGTLEQAAHQQHPYPLLKLTDKWGAFANLWMDYGNTVNILMEDPRPLIKDSNGKTLIKRQPKEEGQWEKDLFETDFIKKNVGTSHYYCPLDKVAKSLTFLLELGWKIEDWQGRTILIHTGLSLALDDHAQTIAVKGKLHYSNYEANVSDVLGAFNRRDQFIQLSATTVGLLPIGKTEQTLLDLKEESEWVGEEVRIKKARFGALDSLWEYASENASLTALKDRWQHFKGIVEVLPSSEFQGRLRPYQQEGMNWLCFLKEYGFHGILADEMGLGKTVQVLAFLSSISHSSSVERPHLIILPTSLLFNWRNEIHQFLPSFKVIVQQGTARAKSPEELLKGDIILTSYTTMRIDLFLLNQIKFHCLILDEAQMIKNAHTQTAQAVCQLQAEVRISITGTPVENHLTELWSHFRFLIPDLFGSLEQFQADLMAAQSDHRYLDRIKKKTAPFFLRRLKKDVAADLPPRIDQVVWIEMEEEQRNLYDRLLVQFKSGLLKKVETEGMGAHRMEVLEALLRLRQVCCHPLLVQQFMEEKNISSAKFDALLEDLQTIVEEGHKVLVYSQFTSMLKLMTREAQQREWDYGYLDGNTVNREEEVTRFQQDPQRSIFFISLKAGGVGLNLTAADYVYLYDPWWNEAVEEQAINRAHRIGRNDSVIAKRFVVAESVEERMMKLKQAKRLIIEELFDSDKVSSSLTLEDLHYLLEGK